MPTQIRLSEAVEEYLRYRLAKGMARTTVTNEGYVLRRFVAWYGDRQMRSMSPQRVAEWFYGEQGLRAEHQTRDGSVRAPVQNSTHNYYRSRLNTFCIFALKRGWLKTDLLDEVDILKEPVRLRQRPDAAGLNDMIDAASCDRDRALISTLIHTALRRNEVLSLRVRDVDLGTGSIYVYISKSAVEDHMPITATLDLELRRWLRSYAVDLGRPLGLDDHMFPARQTRGYRWRTEPTGERVQYRAPDTWATIRPMAHPERVVKAALAATGRPTLNEGTHTLRRAAARAMFDQYSANGYDSALRVVSAWLHHKNSTTTERYLGLDVERKRRDDWLRGGDFLAPRSAVIIPLPSRRGSARGRP